MVIKKKLYWWLTEFEAVSPDSGELHTWAGPYILAPSLEVADLICKTTGLGYCKIIGKYLFEQDLESEENNMIPTFIWQN